MRVPHGGGHSTATLYEASGLDCACARGLRPAWPGARLAGPAYPIRGTGGDNLALHNAVVAAPPGHVLVADLQGAACGHWGEVLAVAAQARGLLGLVIDGGVRDVTELARLRFPVFASSVAVFRTAKDHPGLLGEPIVLRGVPVAHGDLIVADEDGVVCLPAAEAGRVLALADERVRAEERILAGLRAGRTTLELYDLSPSGPRGGAGE
ncbi:RraA family protein [Spongiactinospora sp. 9N601]|uniref:RraA family protein n=1 Tax=Spongiactinospora sp. 9N601 TaxID=3375149 RepID=UPI0037A28CE0